MTDRDRYIRFTLARVLRFMDERRGFRLRHYKEAADWYTEDSPKYWWWKGQIAEAEADRRVGSSRLYELLTEDLSSRKLEHILRAVEQAIDEWEDGTS